LRQVHREQAEILPDDKEAVAFGDGRDMVCAFVNIDMEAVGNWAERRNLPIRIHGPACKPEVIELIRESVEKVNADLANDPKLANAQIRRFIVLHKELDADDEELTRTRKVRRRFIQDKYNRWSMRCTRAGMSSTSTRWSSSRMAHGRIAATLKVRDAKTFARCRTPEHMNPASGPRSLVSSSECRLLRGGSPTVPCCSVARLASCWCSSSSWSRR